MDWRRYPVRITIADTKARVGVFLNIPILANFYVWKGLAIKAGLQPGFIFSIDGFNYPLKKPFFFKNRTDKCRKFKINKFDRDGKKRVMTRQLFLFQHFAIHYIQTTLHLQR